MHLAAQGDRAFPLTYFKTLHEMDFTERDNELSTPLHWACL